ncbi:autophagin-1 (C54 family) [Schistosoma mansoni]|uniref:autophagin-1 (C54 family) n=1 Tax=Schistosoma mansoni TaxID=6183 RepID=UPI0001A6466A|nr:autophagin-1 (C54 family) [Schistosoma mansoni]|eukprot:XP_018655480.1 autophagin-1 (C54 family) [Schistosoma mansoni]
MDSQWEGSIPDHPYLPSVSKSVYILGCKYDSLDDREEIARHLNSRLWMTYRKGFSPIGSRNGPKSDAGWGCMHRCGQMILAEAMLRFHLGRSWKWSPEQESPEYYRLLQMFQDRRSALYSIQTITLTGVSLGKSIGSWFGPNTVAQVLKKLSVYDRWTNLFIHISVEDGIIIDEIKSLCCQHRPHFNFTNNSNENDNQSESIKPSADESKDDPAEESDSSTSSYSCPFAQSVTDVNQSCDWNSEALSMRNYDSEIIDLRSQLQLPVTREVDDSCIEIVLPPTFTSSVLTNTQSNESNVLSTSNVINSHPVDDNIHQNCQENQLPMDQTNQYNDNQINSTTIASPVVASAVFRLPHCVGILGGSPCHAVWIVGVTDDDVICLDPHTTQPAGRGNLKPDYDQTYHCDNPIRIPLKRLDPSMVLGFLCSTEKEFDDLCHNLKEEVLHPSVANSWPLVEIHTTRPSNLPPLPSSNIPNDLLISVYPSDQDNLGHGVNENADNSIHNTNSKDDVEHEGKLSEAMGAVKALWSKCNQVAGDTVRTLANVPQRFVKGPEYEVS